MFNFQLVEIKYTQNTVQILVYSMDFDHHGFYVNNTIRYDHSNSRMQNNKLTWILKFA